MPDGQLKKHYMPLQFTKVSEKNPCPQCGRSDWCELGDRAVHCMRVESSHPAKDGGYYHFYDKLSGFKPELRKSSARPKPVLRDAAALIESLRYLTTEKQYQDLGYELNLPVRALKWTGAVWYANYNAWAWPMFDDNWEIIGIRLRNSDGFKWAVPGSRNGVFIPSHMTYDDAFEDMPSSNPRIIFICEGPTDTSALFQLGLNAIGRPTCGTGFEIIKSILDKWGVFKAVIVADNDELKFAGDRKFRPGIDSAHKLKKFLGIKSVVWTPPSPLKDVRDFVREGGTRQMIEQSIKGKVWTKE
jgi:hypothetical protein